MAHSLCDRTTLPLGASECCQVVQHDAPSALAHSLARRPAVSHGLSSRGYSDPSQQGSYYNTEIVIENTSLAHPSFYQSITEDSCIAKCSMSEHLSSISIKFKMQRLHFFPKGKLGWSFWYLNVLWLYWFCVSVPWGEAKQCRLKQVILVIQVRWWQFFKNWYLFYPSTLFRLLLIGRAYWSISMTSR